MTEHLHHRLAALAARADVPPLDLARLSLTARRRQQRRRLLAVAPVAALLLLAPVAWSAAGSGDDRLSQLAGAGPAGRPAVAVEDLQATVSVEVVAASGTTSTLAVSADPESRPLGASPAEFAFTWSAITEREAIFSPFPRWSTEVSAAEGPGVIGVGGFCGADWGPSGQREGDPCAAATLVSSVAAGDAVDVPFFVYAHLGDRQASVGIYRAALPLSDDQTLEVAVTVTERRPTPKQLFAGPTADEEASGLGGFGPESAGLLRSVRIEAGTAYVDLDKSKFYDGFGTSCGGTAFSAMAGQTLTQFPTIIDVRYAFDGDPRAFVEFMQGSCPDRTPPPGDPCDPTPFQR